MNKKSVLITGCSSGIGLHLAISLHKRDYDVVASARKIEDVENLRKKGLTAIQLDVSNSANIHETVNLVMQRTNGKLYALINNAGYGQPGAVEDLSREALREQFETNLFGAVELTNAVLPAMRKYNSGRIIQISSVLGFVAMPLRGAYIASKYALEGITDTQRIELNDTSIFISLVEPGPITSRFRQNSFLMYKKHIDSKKSRFHLQYLDAEKKLNTEGAVAPFTLEPEAVLQKVLHALQSSHPKPRYFVTFPTYLFAYLKRILPTFMLDSILAKSANVERK